MDVIISDDSLLIAPWLSLIFSNGTSRLGPKKKSKPNSTAIEKTTANKTSEPKSDQETINENENQVINQSDEYCDEYSDLDAGLYWRE